MDAMLNSVPGSRKMTLETALIGQAEVEVAVADTGIGIPKDNLASLFDTFFTTKPHALRPSRAAPGSDCRSRAQSSKPMAIGSGRRIGWMAARCSASLPLAKAHTA